MYEIVKIQMHFQSNYLILLFFNNISVDLGKEIKNEIYFFSFGESIKKNNGQSWILLYGTNNDVG
jgi:hypothetical protein